MAESKLDRCDEVMRWYLTKESFQGLQDAILVELRENWRGCGEFDVKEIWNRFVIRVALRVGVSRGDLRDSMVRQDFRSLLFVALRELERQGLVRPI
jgi:hypothetical protein